jgi:uncharacterized membrane protein YhiD involved in acid resistance
MKLMNFNLDPRRKKEVVTLIIVFLAVLTVSAFAVYFIAGRQSVRDNSRQAPQAGVAAPESTPADRRSAPNNAGDENFLDRLFGANRGEVRTNGEGWAENVGSISLRLLLAALLGAALAFRPRRRIVALKRNPYVGQTQILLAIVAAALMIIVGDNAARAFGIFAAVSLVRFRTNIRDPKEITVLLISLSLGLAAGVGRWDLALILAAFALVVLWLLESREPALIFRSMEVKVTTKNIASTQRVLRQVFKKHNFDSELRGMAQGAEALGSVVYAVDVSPTVTTDQLSEDILSLEEQNIEGIEWTQKKSFSYLYQ